MAFSQSVDGRITDSVTQANVALLGLAPAVAMGNLYLATSQALAGSAHAATIAQQNNDQLAQAVTLSGVLRIYGAAK